MLWPKISDITGDKLGGGQINNMRTGGAESLLTMAASLQVVTVDRAHMSTIVVTPNSISDKCVTNDFINGLTAGAVTSTIGMFSFGIYSG